MFRSSALCVAALACSVALSGTAAGDPPTPSVKPATAPEPAAAPEGPVATAIPLPRHKPPPYPPLPKAKPSAPSGAASVDEPYVAPTAVAAQPAKPLATAATDDGYPCGDACGEILFQVVENCLWVQSQNPRPIVFQASVTGRMMVVPLEGASASKADALTTVATKGPPPALSAYHTRLKDPFQSSSPGLPVYRAKLGGTAQCVKDKAEISAFRADFKR
jgi:hypothetical protein